MTDDSARPAKGRIWTFPDFIGPLTAKCRICAATTTVAEGVTSGGCEHIEVIMLDETPSSAGGEA